MSVFSLPMTRVYWSLVLLGGLGLLGLPRGALAEVDSSLLDQQENPVPFGPGSSWVVGDQLFAAGDMDQALPFLHLAYRADPQVPVIALEFQEALQNSGYFNDALGVLDTLVADFPDSLDFRFRRAQLKAHMGQTKSALKDLAYLREQEDVTEEVLSLEASILSATGKVDQALDVLRDGLALFPDRGAAIYIGMAAVLDHNGRTKEIPAILDKALLRFPRDPDLHLLMIRTLAGLGRPADALAAATAADRLFHPQSGAAPAVENVPDTSAAPLAGLPAVVPDSFRVELADYYAHNKDSERAVSLLMDLSDSGQLGLDPSLWLARMLLGKDRIAEGKLLVEKILAAWPTSGRGWFLKGRIAEQQKNWSLVVADLTQAARLAPRDPEIRLGLVRGMMLSDEDSLEAAAGDSARREFSAAFKRQVLAAETLVPQGDRHGQMMLGYAFRKMGKLAKGAAHFQLAAEDPDLRLNALIQASLCLDEAGETSKARGLLETLRKENPDNPEIANSLGYFLAEKNQELPEAERLVQEALAADPSNGAYLDSMGWIQFRRGNLDKALDYLIRAANAIPEDPIILEHLGVVLNEQGQKPEARDLFLRALRLGGDSTRLKGRLDALDQ